MKTIPKELDRLFTIERLIEERSDGPPVYRASLSSELPISRWFGTEVLRHTPEAVNMERAGRGLALLFNHNVDEPIGKVSDIRIENKRMVGTLRFSPNSDKGPRIAADVEAGFLGDVSIRYAVDEYTTEPGKDDKDTVTITRWTPLEASIVTVPADSTVGVGRNRESITMTTENTATGGTSDGGVNVVAFKEVRETAQRAGITLGAQHERERIEDINALFDVFDGRGPAVTDLRRECIRAGASIEQSRKSLLELLGGEPSTTATAAAADDEGTRVGRRVEAGTTALEKMATGMQAALEAKTGIVQGDAARKALADNEFAGLTLREMARAWAVQSGMRVGNLDGRQVIGALFGGRRDVAAMGTTEFPGIIANVANKALLQGWEENPGTWRPWCRIGSVNDFRQANRTGLSGMDLLDTIVEHGEYVHGDVTDRTEYLTAKKYGKLFSITREAILADDLQAFSAVPRKIGRAAEVTINKVVYDLLCSASGVGPTLNQDSVALFSAATHVNYTATAGAPSVANIEVGRNAMARQLDPNNGYPLNIQPMFLLVPSALVTTAKVLVASEKDPLGTTSATGGATTPNPFYNSLTVIGEPYLDGQTNGTTAWYLIGSPTLHDTFEVAFVNGQQTPYMESRDGWTVDGIEYKVRVEFAVAALDFRAMYRKKGA